MVDAFGFVNEIASHAIWTTPWGGAAITALVGVPAWLHASRKAKKDHANEIQKLNLEHDRQISQLNSSKVIDYKWELIPFLEEFGEIFESLDHLHRRREELSEELHKQIMLSEEAGMFEVDYGFTTEPQQSFFEWFSFQSGDEDQLQQDILRVLEDMVPLVNRAHELLRHIQTKSGDAFEFSLELYKDSFKSEVNDKMNPEGLFWTAPDRACRRSALKKYWKHLDTFKKHHQ